MHTCFDARIAILYLGSRAGTLITDLMALNVLEILRKSSSICIRGHRTGSKTKTLQRLNTVNKFVCVCKTLHAYIKDYTESTF